MEKQRSEQSEKRREEKKQGDIEEKESKNEDAGAQKGRQVAKERVLIWASPKWPQLKKSDENLWTPRDVVLLNGHEGPTALGSWSQTAGREAQGESWLGVL